MGVEETIVRVMRSMTAWERAAMKLGDDESKMQAGAGPMARNILKAGYNARLIHGLYMARLMFKARPKSLKNRKYNGCVVASLKSSWMM